MFCLDSVTFSYPHSKPIFQDFSWTVNPGEAWSVLGPSGGGKTTILYLLAGLVFPSTGKILVDGLPLTRPRPQTGLILQEYGLLPWATLRQNVELGQKVRTFYGPDGKHAPSNFKPDLQAMPWLDRLGLLPFAEKYPGQVSGGQRQRAAIARTLALKPDLLLMDEPFSSLDAPTRESLQNLTLELRSEQGLTLIIVTHSIEEAAILGEKILLLENPPNKAARIVDNPQCRQAGFRISNAYSAMVRDLRAMMDLR